MRNIQQEIAFAMAKGMVGHTATEMLRRIGSLDNFFTLSRSELASLAGVDSLIFDNEYRQQLLASAEKEAHFVTANNIKALFLGNADYPRRLSDCEDAPAIIYTLGDCNLDASHIVSIVGTRHATPYGVDFTTRLVTELSERIDDLIIISGLAYGIDVAAHKAALSASIPTTGVLAHGLNMIYPADHRNIAARMIEHGGALITEYPTSAGVHRSNFLARNRIVAALCDCVVVVESDFKGGSMSTARTAMAYNRDVFALPGRITDLYSRGTNQLIYNNTATMLRNADDMVAQMGWNAKEKAVADQPQLIVTLDGDQKRLYDFIVAHPEATVNDICVALGISYSHTSNLIFELEMKDAILSLPGGRFAPTLIK